MIRLRYYNFIQDHSSFSKSVSPNVRLPEYVSLERPVGGIKTQEPRLVKICQKKSITRSIPFRQLGLNVDVCVSFYHASSFDNHFISGILVVEFDSIEQAVSNRY